MIVKRFAKQNQVRLLSQTLSNNSGTITVAMATAMPSILIRNKRRKDEFFIYI